MIISVDHGNKSIKTPNALFTSGLIVSEGLQGFKTDYICWNNKYYTLTEQRIPISAIRRRMSVLCPHPLCHRQGAGAPQGARDTRSH